MAVRPAEGERRMKTSFRKIINRAVADKRCLVDDLFME
jgi:hypothetical protein